jgi:hypothetical protein
MHMAGGQTGTKGWDKRYFVCRDGVLSYYHRQPEKDTKPQVWNAAAPRLETICFWCCLRCPFVSAVGKRQNVRAFLGLMTAENHPADDCARGALRHDKGDGQVPLSIRDRHCRAHLLPQRHNPHG